MPTIEETEERRAARKAEHQKRRDAQYAIDLEALDMLEVEHGDDLVVRVDTDRYAEGQPTMVVLRLPTAPERKRYEAMVKGKGKKEGDPLGAAALVADSCRLYPEKEVFEDLCETFTGLKLNCGVQAVKAAQGQVHEEGKD